MMYLLTPLSCPPLPSSHYLHIGVRAAVLGTPSGWELSVDVRTEIPFDVGQQRHKFRFGPALVEGLHIIIAVPKQVSPMMIAA
jgi:hypothetical protein